MYAAGYAGGTASAGAQEHAVAINNVSVSTEYVTKLRQELDNYTGGLGCVQGAFVWQMPDGAVPRMASCVQPALHVNR